MATWPRNDRIDSFPAAPSRSFVAVTSFSLVFIAIACATCTRERGVDLGEARSLIAGPRRAGLVWYDSSGAPSRLLATGERIGLEAGASLPAWTFAIFETPADIEDDASRSSVLLISGREEPGEAIVRRWTTEGALDIVARVPLSDGETVEPRCVGAQASGAISGRFLTLLVSDAAGARRGLVLDVRTGSFETWPDVLFDPTPNVVSVSPSGNFLTVIRKLGATPEMLIAGRTRAEPPRVIGAVEPIAPVWLADVDLVMFVRTGGSIFKCLLPDGEPEWLIPGSFSTGLPRSDLAVRERRRTGEPESRRVAVEKTGFDGYVQVTWLEPFPSGSEREKNLTNGSVDHFGAAWSEDGRLLAFRQRERRGDVAAEEERLIVVDTHDGFSATTVDTRVIEPTRTSVGPVFGADGRTLFAIVDGRLRRYESSISALER